MDTHSQLKYEQILYRDGYYMNTCNFVYLLLVLLWSGYNWDAEHL